MKTCTSADLGMVHRKRAARPLILSIAWLFSLGACASQPTTVLFDLADPSGDVRLRHPDHPLIQEGTFDLEHFRLLREGDQVVAEVTFGAPLRSVRNVRIGEDLAADLYPQTIDIYLDTVPGEGQIKALPGRGFAIPASEAWDWVLVVSALDDLSAANLIRPTHVVTRGRTLRATFDGKKIPPTVRGVLVTVLATGVSGEGRVRQVQTGGGDCQVWQDERCTLEGKAPPVLDATSDVNPTRPVQLTYADGTRPQVTPIPIAFKQGELVTASPVPEGQLVPGALVTLVDGAGTPLATATVLSVAGEVASLRCVDGPAPDMASGILPASPAPAIPSGVQE